MVDYPKSAFSSAVCQRFRFLDALGYQQTELADSYVRYERGSIAVEIYHGRQSYELGVNLVRNGVSYSLEEMLELHRSYGGNATFEPFAATDQHGIEIGVDRLAAMLQSCIQLVHTGDTGDTHVYRELDQRRAAVSKNLALDVLAEQLRPKAELAFRAKDYRRAAEFYDQIRERLSLSELRKLEIAKARS
jgi:hypothetical protein